MRAAISVLLLLSLAACGGGGGGAQNQQPTGLGTLAYVVSECREGPGGFFGTQSLRVQQGEREPVTVFDVPLYGPLPAIGLCPIYGQLNRGIISVFALALQRMGVTPDGSGVVFEVTDDFSINAINFVVPPEREGIYYVRADGTGLRRLGPASRDAMVRYAFDPSSPIGITGTGVNATFNFSPDGQTFVYADVGVGPAGEEAFQVFTQEVATGRRTQVTRLPFGAPKDPLDLVLFTPFFVDDETIAFGCNVDLDGTNPGRNGILYLVDNDGSDLRVSLPLANLRLPSGTAQPRFAITSSGRVAYSFQLAGPPENSIANFPAITEVFIGDGENLLQLSNLRRVDTALNGMFVDVDSQRVFFTASSNVLGTNPRLDCQLFAVDAFGTELRQVTHFSSGEPSQRQCGPWPGAGCFVATGNGFRPSQDARSGTIILESNCGAAGNDPGGQELFAMNPDGSGLRQLTHTRGMVPNPGGGISVELPGPYAYGPYR